MKKKSVFQPPRLTYFARRRKKKSIVYTINFSGNSSFSFGRLIFKFIHAFYLCFLCISNALNAKITIFFPYKMKIFVESWVFYSTLMIELIRIYDISLMFCFFYFLFLKQSRSYFMHLVSINRLLLESLKPNLCLVFFCVLFKKKLSSSSFFFFFINNS